MNNNMPNGTDNSRVVHESFAYYSQYHTPFSNHLQDSKRMHSSSVTSDNSVWSQNLRSLISDPAPKEASDASLKTESDPKEEQMQKNLAAIKLLESWYEEDAQEQRETWKYLKRVLDEDRLSDRKLFP